MESLEYYLNTLFDGLSGYVYSPVKSDIWEQHWFTWPEDREKLKNHIRTSILGDVYISPAVYNDRRATKDAVKKLQTVYVEFDGIERIDFRDLPIPNMIVQTSSETHVHCYWRIEDSLPSTVEDINRRLTYHLQADSSGWDCTQLLRPPETINHKRLKHVILADSQERLALPVGTFDFVPSISTPSNTITVVEDLLSAESVLKEHSLSLKIQRMVRKEEPVEPHRSSFLTRLANELAEEGLTHLEVVSLLKYADARIGKYTGRSDELVRLSQLADYAIHKHIAEEEIVVYTPESILKYTEDIQWILPGLLHTTGQLVIASAPAVGKTQLCMQLAYCLETKTRWLGFLASMTQRVFFMSLEMDKTSLKYILQHQQSEWSTLPKFSIIDEQTSWNKYENLIERLQPTVVIIDSLTELLEEGDNPNIDAKRVMRWVRKIRRRYGVAIVLIHHNRKATEGNKKPKSLADLAGSFIYAKDTDTVLQLWEDHKGIELSDVKTRFGKKGSCTFMVERNDNLWFRRLGENVSNGSESIQPDTPGTRTVESSSDRRGDELHGFTKGAVSFGFGGKDSKG